eukprot:tig00000789_g4103.t1
MALNSSTRKSATDPIFPEITEQLWKTWDTKANKNGGLHTVYFRTLNQNHGTVKRGKPPPKVWAQQSKQYVKNTYLGQWRDNLKHGYGIQIEKNGNKYEGEWNRGRRHGQGTYYVCINGKLVKRFEGHWCDDTMQGRGKYYYPDGTQYDGEWLSNERHGQGRFTYASGDLYEGQWHYGLRQGYGILDYANGDRFEGYWVNDRKEGAGTYYYASSGRRYDGEWVADVAKAGVMTEVDKEGQAGPITLPRLELSEPMQVIERRLQEIRLQREQAELDAPADSRGPAAEGAESGRGAAREEEEEGGEEGAGASEEDVAAAEGLLAERGAQGMPAGEILEALRAAGGDVDAGDVQAVLDMMGLGPENELGLDELAHCLALLRARLQFEHPGM